MQSRLPDGFVGAEIILDGECWVVTRPIGNNVPSRAVRAERIEETFGQLSIATKPATIAPEISARFCLEYRDQVPENLKAEHIWEVLLAWLSRDQECRLDDIFDWRSRKTGSGSPAQELSIETKLAVLRLAMRALSRNEIDATAQARDLTRRRNQLSEKIGHLNWVQMQRFEELCEKLSIPAGRDPADEMLRKELVDKANEQLMKALGAGHTNGQDPKDTLLGSRHKLQSERNEYNDKRAEKKARLRSLPQEISAARSEQGIEQARLETDIITRCMICHVHLDKVKADGCGISLERCDLDEVRARIAQSEQAIRDLEKMRKALPDEIAQLDKDILDLDNKIDKIESSISAFFQQDLDIKNSINQARELVREARWFNRDFDEQAEDILILDQINNNIEVHRQKIVLERERAATSLTDLATAFRQVVASLMPRGCTGRLKLDGNGLHADISLERGAGLSTTAIESFKIIAFDLAAMIVSANGKADIPSFLIHDSPREADLDASIYSNLFDFMLRLDQMELPPSFQYIITTTTEPARITQSSQAIRLKLSSTPPDDRLFTMDF